MKLFRAIRGFLRYGREIMALCKDGDKFIRRLEAHNKDWRAQVQLAKEMKSRPSEFFDE